MATNPITIQKQNPDKFSLLYKLNNHSQGTLLIHTLEYIDDLDCLGALNKTCKFFNETLKSTLEELKIYKPLMNHVFESWQEVLKLPKLKEPLTKMFDFSDEEIDKIPNSIMKGYNLSGQIKTPILIFKTIVRNSDGNEVNKQLEILFHTSYKWMYHSKKHGSDSPSNEILNHFKRLIKHEPAGIIDSITAPPDDDPFIPQELAYENIIFFESNPKTTKDGIPIVELTEEKMNSKP
ncbi:MAG: hypothetical protein K940chlam5_00650 [Candidatus Anoxychlamydiales bacterium]|nr:hypothetical protein [Candidatus Anoxychlamydiales bacterium]NGX49054.1 hypothetical protein [Candidatus Anoxychlamydiales bacterium]